MFHLPLLFATLLLMVACQSSAPPTSPSASAPTAKKERPAPAVTLITAAAQELQQPFEGYAQVVALRQIELLPPFGGDLLTLSLQIGDRVAKGERVATLDTTLLRQQLTAAQSRLDQATQELQRLEKLIKQSAVSRDQLLSAQTEQTGRQQEVATLRFKIEQSTLLAPFAGVVTARPTEAGSSVTATTHLVTLTDPRSFTLRLYLPAIPFSHLTESSRVELYDAQGSRLGGQIERLYPHALPDHTQPAVDIQPDPPLRTRLNLGEWYRVRLYTPLPAQIVVPLQSLQSDGHGHYLYLVNGDSKVERRTVTIGSLLTEGVTIASGLKGGEQVITSGLATLRAGLAVRVVTATQP